MRKLLRLGDHLVDWNEQFRLFMFSAVGVPITSPQASALVNTINFNTTEASLTEQVGQHFANYFYFLIPRQFALIHNLFVSIM